MLRLLGARRADHQELLNAIAKVITATPDARDALIAAMAGSDQGLRRAALRIATLGDPADFEAFILQGSKMADPVIRAFVARAAAASLCDPSHLDLLRSFATDPFASVRQVALAMDRSASVRDLARFQLRKRRQVDFARLYRQAMAGAPVVRLVVAITGLGEVGVPSDGQFVLEFLSHPSARVRRASVRAVVQLSGETFLRDVLPCLHDPVHSVSSIAASMLSRHAAAIGRTELCARFQGSVSAYLRTTVLRVIAALPKWDSISILLDAATDHDDAVASAAREHVLRWTARYNRSSIAPTVEQLELVRASLVKAEVSIAPGVVREIRFVLDSWPRT